MLNEFEVLKDDKNCLDHIGKLLVNTYLMKVSFMWTKIGRSVIIYDVYFILKGDTTKVVKELSKLVHRHPDSSCLWLTLSGLLLKLQSVSNSYTSNAAKCALRAMNLGQSDIDMSMVIIYSIMINIQA